MTSTRHTPGTHPAYRVKTPLLTVLILIAFASHSQAQFGYGFIGIDNPKTETNFINQWSLQNGAAAAASRPRNLTAPRFQSRDEGFMERYDLATREAMINRIARNPAREMRTVNPSGLRPATPTTTTPTPAPPPAAEPPPKPAVLLANFFDRDRRLAWPSDAPITAGMGGKRKLADQAILAVLNEYDLEGLAHLSNVTQAREKLLDYGRPALEFVRQQATPAMADTFHSFLLALYSSVGLAATVPKAP